MIKLSPIVRVLLTGLATAVAVITVTVPMPEWAQALIVGGNVILAGVGIIPPHVPVYTVGAVPRAPAPPPTP